MRRQSRLKALQNKVNDGLKLAVIDPLTGLHNRRYALNHLDRHIAKAEQTQRALAVLVIDIDHFKPINDTFGHQNGDRVLVEVTRILKDNLRASDLVSRFGGEEFLVTMPDTSIEEAEAIAQRLRRSVACASIALDRGRSTSVTLSIGATIWTPDASVNRTTKDMLIAQADAALYAAKSNGRNKVSLSREAA